MKASHLALCLVLCGATTATLTAANAQFRVPEIVAPPIVAPVVPAPPPAPPPLLAPPLARAPVCTQQCFPTGLCQPGQPCQQTCQQVCN